MDSFKHPEEALFFRNVFGDAFYLIAVVADEHIRKSRLIERKSYSEKEYEDIADRDAGEDFESGQHAIETIVEADYFFENNFHTKDQISKEAERFLRLVFRTSLDSPRKDEEGMALAFQAALKSACLSRQVGASIFSATGQIIATGCNDVPRFGGGLYTTESTPGDKRCWVHGAKCYNDNEKDVIVQGIISAVGDGLDGADELDDRARTICAEIVGRAVQSSRVKRLLEFSRSIHAEMDALISVARNGQEGIVGSTLYCTTYPCHNCAKHIVGAGVRRVVYLEPYEKSLARKLHSDSIADPSQDSCHEKLAIDVYTGVSPGRYHQLFSSKGMERKDSGRFLDNDRQKVLLVPICAQTIAETSARLKLHLPTN